MRSVVAARRPAMPIYEWRVAGPPGKGFASAAAARLQALHDDPLSFVAFRMSHPLEEHGSVFLSATDIDAARALCARASDDMGACARELLAQLGAPPDEAAPPCAGRPAAVCATLREVPSDFSLGTDARTDAR